MPRKFCQRIKPASGENTDVIFKSKSISRDSFLVIDTDNELADQKLNVYNAAKFSKRPAYIIYPTITEVFSKERLQLLNRERSIVINYYVDKIGAVKEVTFSFRKFTTVNADELAKLEYRILKNISFNIPAKATKGEELFILRDEIPYRGILDRTVI